MGASASCGRKTALWSAVEAGDHTLAASLLENGAKTDLEKKCGFYGATPLIVAASKSDVAMARLLIDAGADVNARNAKELKVSVLHGMINTFCARPAEAQGPDAQKNLEEILQMMLKAGVDVNAASKNPGLMPWEKAFVYMYLRKEGSLCTLKETALHRAALMRQPFAVKLLLDAGADRTIACATGETPAQLAARKSCFIPDENNDRQAQVLALLQG